MLYLQRDKSWLLSVRNETVFVIERKKTNKWRNSYNATHWNSTQNLLFLLRLDWNSTLWKSMRCPLLRLLVPPCLFIFRLSFFTQTNMTLLNILRYFVKGTRIMYKEGMYLISFSPSFSQSSKTYCMFLMFLCSPFSIPFVQSRPIICIITYKSTIIITEPDILRTTVSEFFALIN